MRYGFLTPKICSFLSTFVRFLTAFDTKNGRYGLSKTHNDHFLATNFDRLRFATVLAQRKTTFSLFASGGRNDATLLWRSSLASCATSVL
jgi:hypothetical protein